MTTNLNLADALTKSGVKTIDELEEVTGIDFFFNLPDDIEDSVESHSDISRW